MAEGLIDEALCGDSRKTVKPLGYHDDLEVSAAVRCPRVPGVFGAVVDDLDVSGVESSFDGFTDSVDSRGRFHSHSSV